MIYIYIHIHDKQYRDRIKIDMYLKKYHPIIPIITHCFLECMTTGARPHGYAHHRHEVSDQRDTAMPLHKRA